jgi:hypothetical protein
MQLPVKKSSTGNIGVNRTERIIMEELNWIFRENIKEDYGIDAHIEVVENKKVTGNLLAFQIKSGESYFSERAADDNIIYRGKVKHLNYWLNYSIPVILVLYNPDEENCYWEHITENKAEMISESSWKLEVPSDRTLDIHSKEELINIAENITEYERKFNWLLSHKKFMEELIEGNRIVLESTEWVNKSSGRGSLKIKILDSQTGNEEIALDWPTAYFGMQSYEKVFKKLFPWANISVDEEKYYDYELDQFKLDNGAYDSETSEYYFSHDHFREWRETLPPIRPYQCDGEVAHYRLVLTLNSLGKSFLKINDYLNE